MLIGGFHPLSLSDFPGTPAAVIFLQGCNWNCWYCHNKQLLPMQPGENEINEEWIIKTLTERKDLLKGVTITGGEPTLQPGLADFMEKLKILGFQVKLDTNGTRPQVIQDLLTKNLPDFIAMDIKGPWAKYEQIVGKKVKVDTIKQSIELIANSGLPHLFRTTVETKYLIPEDLEEIRTFLPKNSEYITQPYKQI